LLGARDLWVARARAAAPIVAGCVVLALALRLVYGRGLLGYDANAALLWATDLAHGRVPEFESPYARTPHPLFYLGLVPVSLLGRDAPLLVEAVSWLSFALLGYAAMRLGRALFSPPVGIAFAALLLTRPLLVGEVQQAFVDIPCLALVLLAAALEAERPRRGVGPLVLLAFAGLLRPESWLLAALYALYATGGRDARSRVRLAALAAIGPVVWALSDLLIAGDPLHSLHSTQTLADRLERVRGLGNAFDVLPDYLGQSIGDAVVIGGAAGGMAALYLLYRRALLPAAVLALGLLGFLVLGVADLPLLRRYLLPAGAMLALFCAVALLGWTMLEGGSRLRRGWAAASVVVAVALAASLPGLVDDLRDTRSLSGRLGSAQRSLAEVLERDKARALARACSRATVPDAQLALQLALSSDVRLERIRSELYPPASGSLFVAPAASRVRPLYLYEGVFVVYSAADLHSGYRRALSNGDWAVWARC
jgi:hypothetical protein